VIDFVYRICWSKMMPKKENLINGRLRRRTRNLDIDDINDYGTTMLDGSEVSDAGLMRFIVAATTNKLHHLRNTQGTNHSHL